MKIYLLVDEPMTGKTTLLEELGYTFCSDDGNRFSGLHRLIYEGKKKIAIDDYRNEGSAKSTLKDMYDNKKLTYEQKFKDPVSISPEKYKDVEIVLSTLPIYLNEISLGLQAKCQKVSVEEFKRIKGLI